MTNNIAITGMGIVSSIGTSLETNRKSLLQATSGLGQLQKINSIHASEIKVGEVALSNSEISAALKLPPNHNFTRTALLGSLAAKEALVHASIEDITAARTGFISATTVGGMDKTEIHFKEFNGNPAVQKYVASHEAGDSTQKIADQLGITGFTTTISTACSSAANAIMLGARMIRAGQLDRVVVGGTDALSKFTINGFKSLLLLSDEPCAPFDANRKGLNLGEAAAYLVLESSAAASGKKVLAYLSGYGNTNDAHHQTASSPDGTGAFMAMQKALEISNLSPAQIQYVNAHGTATPNNDLSESVALQRLFGDLMPYVSSTKGFTGHTLAAAGAVEAVFSVLMLQEQSIFPNLNFKTAMPETGLVPVTRVTAATLKNVLSNSFGFGGNCASLIFNTA